MRYGISAAALIVQNNQVLLVNHKTAGQFDFWLPPGGRLEKDQFWIDVEMENSPTRYLGLETIRD